MQVFVPILQLFDIFARLGLEKVYTTSMHLTSIPFLGAEASVSPKGYGAAIFGAPHGTPYPGIDNDGHGASANALRRAVHSDRGWVDHWDFDLGGPMLAPGFRVADLGDLPTTPQDGPGNRALIHDLTAAILADGAVPILLGGDDSTPIPFIQAFGPHGPLTILQIDAHIDWRDDRLGERMGFSSTMRRASEMAHVTGMVQIGARGLGSARETEVQAALAWGARIVTAQNLHALGLEAALALVPRGGRVLIALDIDALDSAVMPACAYPSPGGLGFGQVIGLIQGVAARARIAGFSLVEFVPDRDVSGTAAFTAARIVCNLLGQLSRA